MRLMGTKLGIILRNGILGCLLSPQDQAWWPVLVFFVCILCLWDAFLAAVICDECTCVVGSLEGQKPVSCK